MGRDKALLPHPVSGQPLLLHQASLLRSLPGCAELLLSAPADRGYTLSGARLVPDAEPDLGPLAGLAAGLAAATTSRLLVLAVDLPFVDAVFLQGLLPASSRQAPGAGPVGHVPRRPDGLFEPLCSVYPVSNDSRSAVSSALARRELSLQRLLTAACAGGWMRPRPIGPEDSARFVNWNTPGDLPDAPHHTRAQSNLR